MSSKFDAVSGTSPESMNTSDLSAWFAALGGAVMWFLHLVSAYLISEFGYVSGWGKQNWLGLSGVVWLGMIASVLMLIGAAGSYAWASRIRKRYDNQQIERLGKRDGNLLLVRAGVLANKIFILIIVVQTIPFMFYIKGP